MLSLEGFSRYLDVPIASRKNSVMKCAYVAFLNGYTVFGIKDGGQCFTGRFMMQFYIGQLHLNSTCPLWKI